MFYKVVTVAQGSGTYGSRDRCGSFDDRIWLAWYFLNTIVTNETFCNFPTKLSATPCSIRSRINSKKDVTKENSEIYHCFKLLVLLKNAHVDKLVALSVKILYGSRGNTIKNM